MTVSDELVRKGAIALLHAAVGYGKLSDLEDREVRRLMDDARTVALAIAPAIRAAERERCAKVADARGWQSSARPVMSHHEHRHDMADEIAAVIRAMGDGG